MNQIQVIEPYRHAGTWVFDDPRVQLEAEPFVEGVPQMIDSLLRSADLSATRFRLLFSADPFPGHLAELERYEAELDGWWYRLADMAPGHVYQGPMMGWLCPALFKYFDEAPERLFVKPERIE